MTTYFLARVTITHVVTNGTSYLVELEDSGGITHTGIAWDDAAVISTDRPTELYHDDDVDAADPTLPGSYNVASLFQEIATPPVEGAAGHVLLNSATATRLTGFHAKQPRSAGM